MTNTAHDNDGKVSTSKTPSLEVSLQDPATAGLLPDLDKKQLAVIADHLQIVGRSRMNKDQLVEAITPKLPQPGDAAAAPAAAPAKVQGAAKKAAQAKAAGGSKQVDPNFKGMVPDDAAAVPTKASPKAAPAKAVVESCEKCGFRFPKPQARTTCRSTDACQRRQDGKASRGTSASGTGGQANTARAERAAAANKEAKALKAWEKGDEATRGDRPATPNLDAINGDVAAQAS